jgi:hypothetical protein
MSREEVILVVASVITSAIVFALPILSLLWKTFSVVADIRLQLAELRHRTDLLSTQVEIAEENWKGVSHQTNEKFNHFSTRFRGEVHQLNTQVRELQSFLAKTTSFEVRSQ